MYKTCVRNKRTCRAIENRLERVYRERAQTYSVVIYCVIELTLVCSGQQRGNDPTRDSQSTSIWTIEIDPFHDPRKRVVASPPSDKVPVDVAVCVRVVYILIAGGSNYEKSVLFSSRLCRSASASIGNDCFT